MGLVKCPNCNNQIDENISLCPYCATRVPNVLQKQHIPIRKNIKKADQLGNSEVEYLLGKLMGSVGNYVRAIDRQGGKEARLLAVYNSYDHDMYCISAANHENMKNLLNKSLRQIQLPSKLGDFEIEKFPIPMEDLIGLIKQRLGEMGSKNYKVNVITVPVYRHPYRGIFDKRANIDKLIQKGYCKTIEIIIKR